MNMWTRRSMIGNLLVATLLVAAIGPAASVAAADQPV